MSFFALGNEIVLLVFDVFTFLDLESFGFAKFWSFRYFGGNIRFEQLWSYFTKVADGRRSQSQIVWPSTIEQWKPENEQPGVSWTVKNASNNLAIWGRQHERQRSIAHPLNSPCYPFTCLALRCGDNQPSANHPSGKAVLTAICKPLFV